MNQFSPAKLLKKIIQIHVQHSWPHIKVSNKAKSTTISKESTKRSTQKKLTVKLPNLEMKKYEKIN
jgi:hypothetical protein